MDTMLTRTMSNTAEPACPPTPEEAAKWHSDREVRKVFRAMPRRLSEAVEAVDEPSPAPPRSAVSRWLTALGFTWDLDDTTWEAQFARLAAYQAVHGDCDVPMR